MQRSGGRGDQAVRQRQCWGVQGEGRSTHNEREEEREGGIGGRMRSLQSTRCLPLYGGGVSSESNRHLPTGFGKEDDKS